MIIKVLETVDGNAITYSKSVMQMPGQGPMEMDMNMMNMGGRADRADRSRRIFATRPNW